MLLCLCHEQAWDLPDSVAATCRMQPFSIIDAMLQGWVHTSDSRLGKIHRLRPERIQVVIATRPRTRRTLKMMMIRVMDTYRATSLMGRGASGNMVHSVMPRNASPHST